MTSIRKLYTTLTQYIKPLSDIVKRKTDYGLNEKEVLPLCHLYVISKLIFFK